MRGASDRSHPFVLYLMWVGSHFENCKNPDDRFNIQYGVIRRQWWRWCYVCVWGGGFGVKNGWCWWDDKASPWMPLMGEGGPWPSSVPPSVVLMGRNQRHLLPIPSHPTTPLQPAHRCRRSVALSGRLLALASISLWRSQVWRNKNKTSTNKEENSQ